MPVPKQSPLPNVNLLIAALRFMITLDMRGVVKPSLARWIEESVISQRKFISSDLRPPVCSSFSPLSFLASALVITVLGGCVQHANFLKI